MSETYTPAGRRFFDMASGRDMLLVDEQGHPFDGWLCFKHPDGQWVSQRRATTDDLLRLSIRGGSRAIPVDEAKDVCPTCGAQYRHDRRVAVYMGQNNPMDLPRPCPNKVWHGAATPPAGEGRIEVVQDVTPVAGDRSRQIWVDDSKPAPTGCAVARNYDDALRMIRRFDYEVLYLDHDLGEDGPNRTGYDLLKQLAAERRVPTRVECISWNPIGRKRIEALVAELGAAAHTAKDASRP